MDTRTSPQPPTLCPCCAAVTASGAQACERCGLLLGHPLVVTLRTGLAMADDLRARVGAEPAAHLPKPGPRPRRPCRRVTPGRDPSPARARPRLRPPGRRSRRGLGRPSRRRQPPRLRAPLSPGAPEGVGSHPCRPRPPAPVAGTSDGTSGAVSRRLRVGTGRGARFLSGKSVGWILLAVGTVCLAAAALAFVLVAWRWLPWPARTAILGASAVVALLAEERVRTRDLRATAEALVVVATSLALGAWGVVEAAGVVDTVPWNGRVVLAGAVLAASAVAVGLVVRRRGPRLAAPDVLTAVGVLVAGVTGALATSGTAGLLVAVLASALAVLAAGLRTARSHLVAAHRATVGAATVVAAAGALRLAVEAVLAWGAPGATRLLEMWPALALAAVYAVVRVVVRRSHDAAILSGAAAGAATALWSAGAVMVLPAAARAWVALAVVLVGAAAAARLPKTAHRLVPAVSGPVVLVVGVVLAPDVVDPVERAMDAYRATLRMTGPVAASSDGALLVLVAGVGALVAAWPLLGRTRATSGVSLLVHTVAAASGLSAALVAAPRPSTVLLSLAAAAAALVAFQRRRAVLGWPLAGVVVLLSLAGLRSDGLGLVALATAATVSLVAALTTAARSDEPEVRTSWLVAAASLTELAAVWTLHVRPAGDVAVGLGALALATAAGSTLLRRSGDRAVAELLAVAALVSGVVVALGGAGATPLTTVLTLGAAGAGVLAVRRADRRWCTWAGAVLSLAAWWVQLVDHGVTTPEPYTLPAAAVLLAAGARALHVRQQTSSWVALSAGLLVAFLPTLRSVVDEPTSLRTTLLVGGATAALAAGTRLRLAAPFVAGCIVLVTVAARALGPQATGMPAWAPLALAGCVLVALGATWESRVRDLRRASAYLLSLR